VTTMRSEALRWAELNWTELTDYEGRLPWNLEAGKVRVNCLVGSYYTNQQNVHDSHQNRQQTLETISNSRECLLKDEPPQHKVVLDGRQEWPPDDQVKQPDQVTLSRFEPVWGERTNRDL
jgi:hypothetical protein